MKRTVLFAAIAAMVLPGLFSCNGNDNENDSPSKIYTTPEYDLTSTSQKPVFILGGGIPSFLLDVIDHRFPNKSQSAAKAELIFVHSNDLFANTDTIREAFERNAIIVEVQPDSNIHSPFWTSIGANPCINYDDRLLWVAIQGNSCCQFHNPLENIVEGTALVADDLATESSTDMNEPEIDRTPLQIGETFDCMNMFMSSFVGWVNSVNTAQDGTSTQLQEFESEIWKHMNDARYSQIINTQYKLIVKDYQLCKVIASSPDCVSRESSADLAVTITPVYAYDSNSNSTSGDYYFVTLSLIAHNDKMYSEYRKKHGGVVTFAHAFYSKKLSFGARLLTSDYKEINNLEFFENPSPATTQTSASHTTGFTKSLNVSGNGGVADGLPAFSITVGGEFTWSTSDTKTLPDISIEMSTDNNRHVKYSYVTNNMQMNDNVARAVPGISRNDEECIGSWCWHIPATGDGSDKKFKLLLDLNMVYGYMYRHATWGAEGHFREAEILNTVDTITVLPPNRTPMGVLAFKSTNKNYVKDLTFTDSKGTVYSGNALPFQQNAIQNFQLPCDNYDVKFNVYDGNTGELLGSYISKEKVGIKAAEYTDFSTLDAEKIN